MKIETNLCDVCGKEGTRVIHVTKSYGRGDNLLVIENVPVISCPHCGESYLTAVTLREFPADGCQNDQEHVHNLRYRDGGRIACRNRRGY